MLIRDCVCMVLLFLLRVRSWPFVSDQLGCHGSADAAKRDSLSGKISGIHARPTFEEFDW